ncbi:hypothetical protein HYQ46_003138 [Verticillium longisporum]|nr:hypothetical protein HYQ46_003138 [Verticillium longisporum]
MLNRVTRHIDSVVSSSGCWCCTFPLDLSSCFGVEIAPVQYHCQKIMSHDQHGDNVPIRLDKHRRALKPEHYTSISCFCSMPWVPELAFFPLICIWMMGCSVVANQ